MKKNYCKKGHLFSAMGLKRRICPTCQSDYCKQWRLKNKNHISEWSKMYVEKNRIKIREYAKEYAKNNPEKVRLLRQKNWLKNKYGISYEDFNKLIIIQKDKCAICSLQMIYDRCLDHDHNNNKVRGLLCRKCNWLLGYANDSVETLKNAICYLKKHQTVG